MTVECSCFKDGDRGERMATALGLTMVNHFSMEMHDMGICKDATEHTLATVVVLLAQDVASRRVGNHEAADGGGYAAQAAECSAILKRLCEALPQRDAEVDGLLRKLMDEGVQ